MIEKLYGERFDLNSHSIMGVWAREVSWTNSSSDYWGVGIWFSCHDSASPTQAGRHEAAGVWNHHSASMQRWHNTM